MEPDIALIRGQDAIRLYGVTWSLAIFRAAAKRCEPGTWVDLCEINGKLEPYRFRPGAPGAPQNPGQKVP